MVRPQTTSSIFTELRRSSASSRRFCETMLCDVRSRVGATGTLSAIVLDENGRVASDVGVGATAVLSMLGAVPVNGVPA